MTSLLTSLGHRIQSSRKAARMTQQELGDRVGVGKSSVSQWESGFVKELSGTNLVKTAQALGVDPIWLATGKGEKFTQNSKDPLHERINNALDHIKRSIDASERALSEDEIRLIYRFCIDVALDPSIPDSIIEEYVKKFF